MAEKRKYWNENGDLVTYCEKIKQWHHDRNLIDGSDETLQLLAVCSIALEQFKKNKKK